jgi:uncharacterized protein YcbK (DUF882 family)
MTGRQVGWDGTVLGGSARVFFATGRLARASQCIGIAALFLLIGGRSLQTAIAEGDTRTLSFHHVHTNEDITVTFKRNGRYDQAALKKLDWFMRDWRKDEQVEMDPHLFDLLWEAYREAGATEPIRIICGYRAPGTNAMLRARSSGVAQYSLHTKGDAIDFYIPGVPLETIRNVGLRLQRGGVGFYPTSGSPFVHMDTGSIRHWPRLSYDQLVKVFPDGRTVHIPSDGQPLRGYALALADVERHGSAPSSVSLASARNAGVIADSEEQVAERIVPRRSMVATSASVAKDENKMRSPVPVVVASLSPPAQVTTVAIVPAPRRRPSAQIALASLIPTPKSRPPMPIEMASADPVLTVSAAQALAYYAEPAPAAHRATVGSSPMGMTLPKPTPVAAESVLVKSARLAFTQPVQHSNDPWLRATMLTPSASEYLTVLRLGRFDARQLREFLREPQTAVLAMSFSDNPYDGLRTDSFTGHAVVFLATVNFRTRTAALTR